MALPAFLKTSGDAVLLAVKLQPRASRNEIGTPLGDALKIKVTAPPVDSAANEALVRLLAETLDCPRGAVQLVRGQTSRQKVVAIRGLAAEEVARLLGDAGAGSGARFSTPCFWENHKAGLDRSC